VGTVILSTTPLDGAVDDDGFLILTNDGGWGFCYGPEGVRQLVRTALLLFAGEWFLDLDAGIAYWDILGNKYSETALRVIIAAEITDTPGIASLDYLSVKFVDETRTVTVVWRATCVFGDTIEGSATLQPNGGTSG
jgi:hypothetical protein